MKKNYHNLSLLVTLLGCGLHAQSNEELIKSYLNNSISFRNAKAENKEFVIRTEDFSNSMNSMMIQFQQTYDGIPIYNAYGTAVIKDKKVVTFNETFSKATKMSKKSSVDKVESIFAKVLQNSGINDELYDLSSKGKEDSVYSLKVYYPIDSELRLAYLYQFAEKGTSNYWNIIADATTGEILEKQNLTLSCDFGSSHSDGEFHRFIGPENKSEQKFSSLLVPDNASYNVFPLPIEAPSFGGRTLLVNPWDSVASPEGWHSDGVNSYTYTRGNNVFAYTDVTNNNIASPANAADGGASRIFDFPLDITENHTTYTNAALTNLFYLNNKIHDVMYKFGFTEPFRNFQKTNFGGSGIANDPVNAEARDASEAVEQGLNNANFATPADGNPPRMQMYLWDPATVNRLRYNSPATFISRKPNTKGASFGPILTAEGITGDISATTPTDGCSAITEDLTGKIALIQRGTCGFVVKVKNAQLKGATAAIVYNAPASPAIVTMGGTDATITIPSILIENAEGQAIVNQLSTSNVNATVADDKSKYTYIDGDLDNGIIIHEYGHGISNRLIGTTASCLRTANSNEQMGEGWSDFFALMLTNQPGDNASVPRGMGTFAKAQSTTGGGIRLAKYSPDFSINNYTYGKTNGMTYVNSSGATVVDVHSVGFVWATMLWDLHWKYVEKYGYSSDVTANPASGSARVLQLVMDALKLTACSPTLTDGRTAILQAEQNTTGGVDKCMIWGVFAKRGLGVKADAGVKKQASTTPADVIAAMSDQTEDFTYPAECDSELAVSDVSLAKAISVYPNPAKNEIFIKSNSATTGKTLVSIFDASGKLVFTEKIDLNTQNSVDISKLSNGVYILKGEGIGTSFSQKVIVQK